MSSHLLRGFPTNLLLWEQSNFILFPSSIALVLPTKPSFLQDGSNITDTDSFFVTIINKNLLAHVILQRTPLNPSKGRVEVVASLSQRRTAAAQCGLFTHKSVPVIFEPPCI